MTIPSDFVGIDFVGTGVNNVATNGDLVNVFESDGNGDLQPSDSNNGISFFYEYDDNNDILIEIFITIGDFIKKEHSPSQ